MVVIVSEIINGIEYKEITKEEANKYLNKIKEETTTEDKKDNEDDT